LLIIINKRSFIPLHSHFLGLLLFTTAINTVVFLTSPWQSLRYFFPLFFIWDSLLPLFLLHLSGHFHFDFKNRSLQKITRSLVQPIILIIIIFGHTYLLLYNFFIGFYRGLI
jgi:hypothetical protein